MILNIWMFQVFDIFWICNWNDRMVTIRKQVSLAVTLLATCSDLVETSSHILQHHNIPLNLFNAVNNLFFPHFRYLHSNKTARHRSGQCQNTDHIRYQITFRHNSVYLSVDCCSLTAALLLRITDFSVVAVDKDKNSAIVVHVLICFRIQ